MADDVPSEEGRAGASSSSAARPRASVCWRVRAGCSGCEDCGCVGVICSLVEGSFEVDERAVVVLSVD